MGLHSVWSSVGTVVSVGTLRAGAGAIVLSCTSVSRNVVSCCCVVKGKSGMVLVVCRFLTNSMSLSYVFCSCSVGVVVGMLTLWWNHVSWLMMRSCLVCFIHTVKQQ